MSTGTVKGVGFLIANIYSVYWLSSGLKRKEKKRKEKKKKERKKKQSKLSAEKKCF